jgi:predicted transcriptional regulator
MTAQALVIEMAAQYSPVGIAAMLGVTPAAVRYHLRAANWEPAGSRWKRSERHMIGQEQ